MKKKIVYAMQSQQDCCLIHHSERFSRCTRIRWTITVSDSLKCTETMDTLCNPMHTIHVAIGL